MRRIVLTEEEKKRIEERINAQFTKHGRKYIRFCCKCRKPYHRIQARKNGHPKRCSVECMPDGKPRIRKSLEERRRDKKLRIQQRKQAARAEKRLNPVDFYRSDAWKELRYKVLRKYGFSCMACGAKPPKVMHVDHIKPRVRWPELELDINNLQVLCSDCNQGKRHYFQDDLRPKEIQSLQINENE